MPGIGSLIPEILDVDISEILRKNEMAVFAP